MKYKMLLTCCIGIHFICMTCCLLYGSLKSASLRTGKVTNDLVRVKLSHYFTFNTENSQGTQTLMSHGTAQLVLNDVQFAEWSLPAAVRDHQWQVDTVCHCNIWKCICNAFAVEQNALTLWRITVAKFCKSSELHHFAWKHISRESFGYLAASFTAAFEISSSFREQESRITWKVCWIAW